MLPFPPWPVYEADEVEAAAAVLRSGRVNQWTGPDVEAFEKAAVGAFGAPHALAVANGTVALELILKVLGIGPGDEVIVPARTFIATAAAAALQGARPVVVDVDPDSGCMSPDAFAAAVTGRTKAVIPVHLGGWPCDMDRIGRLAREAGLAVVEDCAQAHGAAVGGRPVGSLGQVNTFSFCQDKIVSTGGEGGMVTTASRELSRKVWAARDHGKDPGEALRSDHPPGFRWLHADFGTNARMTGPQAAIGTVQLGKLPRWLDARRRNARILRESLRGLGGLRVPEPGPGLTEAPYRVYAYLEGEPDPARHRAVLGRLAAAKVPVGVGSCGEIYLENAFTRRSWGPAARLPVASALAASSLALPVHPGLLPEHLEWMAAEVGQALRPKA